MKLSTTKPAGMEEETGEPQPAKGPVHGCDPAVGGAPSDPYGGVPLGVECAWCPDAIADRLEDISL